MHRPRLVAPCTALRRVGAALLFGSSACAMAEGADELDGSFHAPAPTSAAPTTGEGRETGDTVEVPGDTAAPPADGSTGVATTAASASGAATDDPGGATTSSTSDASPACTRGTAGCACAPGGSCVPGLLCLADRCADPLGDSDGEPAAVCGDGRVHGDEACDDGNADEADGCRSDCTRPACGDGRIDVGLSCPALGEPVAAVAGASALTWIDPQLGLASAPPRERFAVASAAAHTIALARTGADGALRVDGHAVAETNPVALHSADVDGDGIADLLVATASKAQVSVLPGRSDGTFAAVEPIPLGGTPTALTAGQLDADGHTDLWTGDIPGAGGQLGLPSAARATAWWGQAGAWARGPAIELEGTPRVAAIVALAGDAWPDLLVGLSDPPRVVALEGAPDRSYTVAAHMNMPSNPSVITPVDLDRDGRLDVLVHARTTGESYVIYGGPLARFSHTMELPEQAPLVALFGDDVDGDGDVDLIAVATDGRVRVHARSGTGFAAPQELALAGPAAAALWRPATADGPWCVIASLPTLGAVQAICDAP